MFKKFFKQKIKSSGISYVAGLDGEVIGMTIYRDKLFIATKNDVYFLNKHNKLEPVKFEESANV